MAPSLLFALPIACLAPAVFAIPQAAGYINSASSASSGSNGPATATGTMTTAGTGTYAPNTATGTVTGAPAFTGTGAVGDFTTIPSSCASSVISKTTQCFAEATDWPDVSTWLSWECLSSQAYAQMLSGWNEKKPNTPQEAADVINLLYTTSQQADLDPRVVLSVVMQESVGFVQPGHGDNGASSGLFQVQLQGATSCDALPHGQCPTSSILAMVQEGLYGHTGTSNPQTPGLLAHYQQEQSSWPLTLRAFNTGSVPDRNNLTQITLTGCNGKKYFAGTQTYVSQMANRMVGGLIAGTHQFTCMLDGTADDYPSLGNGCNA